MKIEDTEEAFDYYPDVDEGWFAVMMESNKAGSGRGNRGHRQPFRRR